jgi:hypothetical protein
MAPDRRSDGWNLRHELRCSAVTGLEDVCTCGALMRAVAFHPAAALPIPTHGPPQSAASPRPLPHPMSPAGLRAA